MIFRGIEITCSLKDDQMYSDIAKFWEALEKVFGTDNLKGLGYGWTEDTMKYVIGFKDDSMQMTDKEKIKDTEFYDKTQYRIVLMPTKGWQRVSGSTNRLKEIYDKQWKIGAITYEIETFTEDGRCELLLNRKKLK